MVAGRTWQCFLWACALALFVYCNLAGGLSGYVLGFGLVVGFAFAVEDGISGRIAKKGATRFRLVLLRLMGCAKRTGLWMLLILAPFTGLQVYLNRYNDTAFARSLEDTSLWINEQALAVVDSGAPLYFVVASFVLALLKEAFEATAILRRFGRTFFRAIVVASFATSFTFMGATSGVSVAQQWLLSARDTKENALDQITRSARETAFAQAVTTTSAGASSVVRYVASSVVAGSTLVTTREAIRNYFATELAEMGSQQLTVKQLLLTQTEDMRLASLVEIFAPPLEPSAIRTQITEWKAAQTVAFEQSKAIRSSLASAVETALGTVLPSIPNGVVQAYVDEFVGATADVFTDLTPTINRKFVVAAALAGHLDIVDIPTSTLSRRLAAASFYEMMVPVVADDISHIAVSFPGMRAVPGTIFKNAAEVAAKHAPPPSIFTRILKAIR